MMKKPQGDGEILAQLDASLAEDVLTEAYADDEIATFLRAANGDPEAVGRRGAALAAELLDRRRLAWQDQARRRIERTLPAFDARADYSGLGKLQLLGLLDRARNNPRLSGPVSQLFHRRKPEDITEDELRELLVEVDALAAMDEAIDGADKK
ncbi:MAG: hypothetical protein WBP56_02695 [Polyangia bacterium]|jgi:hypothetical protein